MKDLCKDTLGKIKKDCIAPKPKWQCILKNAVIWAFFGATIVLGSLAFSIILLAIANNDWDLYPKFAESIFSFTLLSLPHVWIGLLILFLILAYLDFRNTTTGYRYQPFCILGSSIIISMIVGTGLYYCDIAHEAEELVHQNVPLYDQATSPRKGLWVQPEKGLLGGKIQKFGANRDLIVISFNGDIWVVNIANADWKGHRKPKVGMRVKILGKQLEQWKFEAYEVRPWFVKVWK